MRRFVYALVAVLACAHQSAALLMDASVISNMPSSTPSLLGSFEISTHQLPGTVDTGLFGIDAANCPSIVGPGYVCGRGYASATKDTYLAATQPTPTMIAVIALKALASLTVQDAPSYSKFQIDAQATVDLPLRCVGVSTNTAQLRVTMAYGGTRSVNVDDPGFGTFVADFFNRPTGCAGAATACSTTTPAFDCTAGSSTVSIKLNPHFTIQNPPVSGWDAQILLDASHTLEVASVDVLDAQGDPIPGARAFIDDGAGNPLGYFLRSEEVGVVGPVDGSTTTTTSTLPGSTTTTTTLPSLCAGLEAAPAAVCRCEAAESASACIGVKLSKPIRVGLKKGCVAARKADAAPGGKRSAPSSWRAPPPRSPASTRRCRRRSSPRCPRPVATACRRSSPDPGTRKTAVDALRHD